MAWKMFYSWTDVTPKKKIWNVKKKVKEAKQNFNDLKKAIP